MSQDGDAVRYRIAKPRLRVGLGNIASSEGQVSSGIAAAWLCQFSIRCASRPAFGMAMTPGWRSSQANASCAAEMFSVVCHAVSVRSSAGHG